MAAGNLKIQKASGGVLNIQPADGTTNTSLVLPASGTVVATDVAVTDNAIARYDGTTGKVQNSGVIIDDNNNVGIGTSTADIFGRGYGRVLGVSSSTTTSALELNSASGYSAYIDFGVNGTRTLNITADNANPFISTIGAIPLSFATNGIERMRIDANGNVGIGGTPDSKLSVFGAAGTNPYAHIKDVSGADLYFQAVGNSDVRIGSASNHSLLFMTNGSAKATLDASGNIGIGTTTSPWYSGYTRAIEIGTAPDNGTIWSSLSQNHSHIGIGANFYIDNNYITRRKANSPASEYSQQNGRHYWFFAPSGEANSQISWKEGMSLGTQADLTINPSLEDVPAYVQCYRGSANNNTYIQAHNTSSSDYPVFLAQVGGVIRAAITSNGGYQSALGVGGYGGTSDIKLKENIVDSSNKLDKLMKVRVVDYNFKSDEAKLKQIGVIAQELEEIFPGMVYETKDTKQVEVEKERVIPAVEEILGEDGSVLVEAKPESIEKYTETETVETGEVTKAVKYGVFTMLMLKGMQEMNAKMEAMQLEINMLKGAK